MREIGLEIMPGRVRLSKAETLKEQENGRERERERERETWRKTQSGDKEKGREKLGRENEQKR